MILLQFALCCVIAFLTFFLGAWWQDKTAYARGYEEGQGSRYAAHHIALNIALQAGHCTGFKKAKEYYLEKYKNSRWRDPVTGKFCKRDV